MSVKYVRQNGWVLLEALIASACIMFVLSSAQRLQSQQDQHIYELLEQHRQALQTDWQKQVKTLFGIDVVGTTASVRVPQCDKCRGQDLRTILIIGLDP